jgi:hypothetical protein
MTHHGLGGVGQPWQCRGVEVGPAHLTSGGHPRCSCWNMMHIHEHSNCLWLTTRGQSWVGNTLYLLFTPCTVDDPLTTLSPTNALYCSQIFYITISRWTFLHISIPKESSSGNQIEVTLHKTKLTNLAQGRKT